jgi:hypothetical protein
MLGIWIGSLEKAFKALCKDGLAQNLVNGKLFQVE